MKWIVLVFFVLGIGFFVYDQFRPRPGSSNSTAPAAATTAREGDYCGPGLASAPHPQQQNWFGIKTWITASTGGADGANFYLAKPVMICNLTPQRLSFDRIEVTCDDPDATAASIVGSTVYFAQDEQYQVNHHRGARAPVDRQPSVMSAEAGRAMTFDSLDIDCDPSHKPGRLSGVKLALMLGEHTVGQSGFVRLPLYAALPRDRDVWREDEEIKPGQRGVLLDFPLGP